ncbi:uncharacterized protein LOC141595681 [Silene latifolia]|uniref:uncharacterized protein LOC141595681 n=1 Tax=Silene latifolia TaxID=37657 RepID=UPI003D776A01
MEQHIDTLIDNITPEIIERNRLKLKVSIVAVIWLTFQHCAFRGHDESVGSLNRGNFLEFIRVIASFSKDVEKVVLENAPGNASYTSHQIQQEILSIYRGRIRNVIRTEIGDQKYCIIVDETKDVSKREQMTVVLRFVDKSGYIQEHLFYLIHVKETNALYLKGAIEKCLLAHKLNIENIRGQGCDGASNMRGEWSGLQALFLNECPYAYYVHCFAHRLQLALIAASRDVISVYQFFSKLTFIVNIIISSAKRHDQLQTAYLAEIERLIELEELEIVKGQNQIGTIKRTGRPRTNCSFPWGRFNELFDDKLEAKENAVEERAKEAVRVKIEKEAAEEAAALAKKAKTANEEAKRMREAEAAEAKAEAAEAEAARKTAGLPIEGDATTARWRAKEWT